MVMYQPWRFMSREEWKKFQEKAFRENAGFLLDRMQAQPPSRLSSAVSQFDQLTSGQQQKDDDGGGFWGGVKSFGKAIGEGALRAGEVALSGEKFQEALGIDTGYMDWLRKQGVLGKAAAFGIDTLTSPLSVATMGAGSQIAGGLRAATAGTKLAGLGRAAGAVVEPAVTGSLGRRALAEAGMGIGGGFAAEAAGELTEDMPSPIRTLAQLGGGLAGGVAGLHAPRAYRAAFGPDGAVERGLAAMQGRPGRQPVFGFSVEEQLDRPMKRPDLIKLRHDEIVERPDLFQARDADPGKSYSEARVRELLEEWDPNKLSPGKVARDINTGQYVVIGGHHRLQLMKRKAAAGEFPKKGTWEVFDADLTNPEHVAELQDIADWDNFLTASTTLAENVRIYRRARARGETDATIAQRMRSVDKQERRYLPYIADLPDDIIERWVVAQAPVATLGEIGKAARTYKWDEKTIRGLVMRYGPGGTQQSITPTELATVLQQAGRAMADIPKGPEGGMFGDDVLNEILVRADEIASIQKELAEQQRTLTSAKNALQRSASKLPEARGEIESIIPKLEARIASLKERRKNAINELQRRKREQFEGGLAAGSARTEGGVPARDGEGAPAHQRAAADVDPASVPARAADPANAPGGAPAAAGADVGGTGQAYDVGSWVEAHGIQGEVLAVRDGAIQIRTEDGTEHWFPTGPDMFGEAPMIRVVERPAKQSGLALEGGSKGQIVPSNQQDFFAEVPVETPAPTPVRPEVPPTPPEPPQSQPPAGQLPRPEGEPKTFPVPGGNEKVVPQMRVEAPEGYKLGVPDQGDPEYRRTLTNADIETQKAKPTPTPLGAPPRFEGDEVQIVEDWATAVSEYHPDLGQPYDTQGVDYRRLKKAATNALRREYERQALGAVGADSLKELDADLAQQIRRESRRHAERVVREVEDSVVREGHWEPVQRSSVGQGIPEGRPTGGVGGRVEEPTGVPEIPKKEPPPPREGLGNTPPLGNPEGGPVDLLGTRKRADVLREAAAEEQRLPAKIKNRLKSALGRLESDEVRQKVDPFIRESQRIDNVIAHQTAWFVMREQAILRQAGMEMVRADDGTYRLLADGRDVGLFEDVIEQVGSGKAGYESLTDAQKEALARIGEDNRLLNETIRFHGGKPAIDDEIEGDYFGRRAIAREYVAEDGRVVRVEKPEGGNLPSRRVGAKRTKSRVMQSIEEGLEKGIRYENPWEARAAIIRGKLLDARDNYLKRSFKPLRVKNPGSTLGLEQVANHPAFNNVWFKPEIARRIQKGLDSTPKGPASTIQAINSVLTPMRASFDLSATLQQGARMWLTDPKHGGEYWWEVMRSLRDPSVYEQMMLRMDAEGPGLQYLLERGLRFTGEGVEGEFFLPEDVLAKLGRAGAIGKGLNKAFTASNQHFGRLLNAYRVHFANSQYQRLVASGLTGTELDDAMRQSVNGINRMFGWTHTKTSTLEGMLLFAPRYTRASIETLVAAVTNRGIEGQMARKHLGLLLAEGAAVVWLLNTARGYETEFDPRDPNFLRLRNVGGLDVSPFGTYNTLFRALAQGIAGDPQGDGLPDPTAIGRFIEGKLSPAAGMLYWPLKGETYMGEPLEPTAGPQGLLGTVREMGQSSLPFGLQNLLEEGPAAAVVGLTGITATPLTPAERRDFARDDVARQIFGQKYEDLTGREKSIVNEDPRVSKHQAKLDERELKLGGTREQAARIRLQVQSELEASAEMLARGRTPDGKPFTGNDFRKAYHETMLRAAGAWSILDRREGDKVIDGWFRLYDLATMPNGQIDYDQLERLQAEYEAQHPDVLDRIEREVGIYDNAAVRELREAKKLAKEYYNIPAYRGMDVAEAEKASRFLALANDLVATGLARNRQHAIAQLRGFDVEGARLALKAARVGANPARKRFRRQNPLFAKYYYDTLDLSAVA